MQVDLSELEEPAVRYRLQGLKVRAMRRAQGIKHD